MKELIKNKTIQERLIEIKELVSTNLDIAKELLQSVIEDNKNDFYLMEINCALNMVKEEELYRALTVDQKKRYSVFKIEGRRAYDIGDYEQAYYYYELAKKNTNHPIFDYYLGKMLYKQEKYEEALPFFQEYLSHGGKKLSNSLLYVIRIYQKEDKNKKANKLILKLQKLEETFKSGFCFGHIHQYKKSSSRDSYKYNASKSVVMDLEDFIEEDFDLNLYEQGSFRQKLSIIKNMMVNDQLNMAESCLNKLSPETNEERQELIQFQKNKKLYRNKRG